VPLEADWLRGASGNLEVGDLDAFLVDEDDAVLAGGDGQDHVEVVAAPRGHDSDLTLRQRKVVVEKQRH